MRRKGKIVLSIFVFLFILFITVNLPIIPIATGKDCYKSSCTAVTYYQSYFNLHFYCFFYGCSGNVKILTLSNITLYHGYSATHSSGATARLIFSVNNQDWETYITALSLSPTGMISSNLTTITEFNGRQSYLVTNLTVTNSMTGNNITHWDSTSEPSSSSNLIIFDSSHYGNKVLASNEITSFTYYPEDSTTQQIVKGEIFNFVIDFAIGQSISGSLIAE